MEKGGSYYEFFHNTRLVKPTILHFQVCELSESSLLFALMVFYIEVKHILIRIVMPFVVYVPPFP